ncbi:RlmF-related methyltransferase, partial [Aeromonas hydrophila]|uniref:RlmF-related methyltransferase n=1 Tax=Aeromonas hydrophila TaxID=644 RepID=UPI0036D8E8BD
MTSRNDRKSGLHPRNRHLDGYDFEALCRQTPELATHLFTNNYGNLTIDFADPAAVKALNRALLAHHYGIVHWDLPAGYLCPPIPGRVDYLH